MKNLRIAIRNKTKLVQKLESLYNIEYDREPSFFEKLFLKDKKPIDIYFHQGIINEKSLEQINRSTKVIVNSNTIKSQIANATEHTKNDKMEVVYPYIDISSKYDKMIKKEFKNKYFIKKNENIIYFTGKDLKISGLEKFLKIIVGLEKSNFKVLIDTDSKQFEKLKADVDKLGLIDKFILLKDYTNKEELFMASDIFVLPTQQKLFVPNVLKAMYFKNAVFVMKANPASEVTDSFSLIYSNEDPSTSFKVNALLSNQQDLNKIQKVNCKIAKKYTLENSLKAIQNLITKNFDI